MDDLDYNPLYRDLLTRFKREFDIACKMSYLITIPSNDSLESILIDQTFVNSHILMPSRLLKMHYNPLQIGYVEDIELEGSKLYVYPFKKDCEKLVANILAETIGYNILNKEYRILLIDRPLINASSKLIRKSLTSSPSSSSLRNNKHFHTTPQKSLKTHHDCVDYLQQISPELTSHLETDVRRLHTTYLILTHYISDAARRIQDLASNYVIRYEKMVRGKSRMAISNDVVQAIIISVETYIVHLMHGKLVATLQRRYDKEEKILARNYETIRRSSMNICDLGAQAEFAGFTLTEQILDHLNNLSSLQSPLAIVSSLIDLVNLVSENLKQSIRVKHMIGDKQSKMMTICSDDLIASLVYSLIYAKPVKLYSLSKYLETFGWSSIAKDQAAYYTATFQVVIQYIVRYTLDGSEELTLSSEITSKSYSTSNLYGIGSGATTLNNSTDLPMNSNLTITTVSTGKLLSGNGKSVDSLESRNSTITTNSSELSDVHQNDWEVI